jgi:hypothetical protein
LVFLQGNVVAAGRGDHLLVESVSQAWDFSDRGSVALKLISVNDLWDVILTQERSQESLCSFRVTVPLKQDIEYETLLVDRSPEPVVDAIDARAYLIQEPAGTRRGSRWRRSSENSALNLMHHSRSVSWLTWMPC